MEQWNEEIQKIRKIIKDEGIRNIYLNFIDFSGVIHSKLVGVQELINNTHVSWNDGISINGTLIKDFDNEDDADWLVLIPDPFSFRIIPFLNENEQKSAMLMCEIKNFELDTRNILKKAVDDFLKQGYVAIAGTQLIYEFMGNSQDFYLTLPTNKGTKFNNFLVNCLLKSGIDIEYYMPYGNKHYRIDLVPDVVINSADKLSTAKWFLESLAIEGDAGVKLSEIKDKQISSCPVHLSLWKENRGKNLFFEENDDYELSDLAKKFINGILYNHKIIEAVSRATSNQETLNLVPKMSIKRDDALLQIPLYFKEKQKKDRVGWSKRCVFNGLKSDCNYYLCFATILYAGLYGIDNDLKYEISAENIKEYSNKELINEIKNSTYFNEKLGKSVINKIIERLGR